MNRLLVLLLLTGCAHSDPWTRQDTALQVGVTLALAADAVTTARIQETPGVWERGPITQPILGSQPDSNDVYLYFLTVAASDYLIARALPARWRPYFQSSMIGYYAYLIDSNCDRGLCE